MIQLNITPVPNQQFTARLDGARYTITLKTAQGVTLASILRDGVPVVESVRVLAGELIIPYQYKENGNFGIITENNALPNWEQFGISQFFYYFTPAELAEFRNG